MFLIFILIYLSCEVSHFYTYIYIYFLTQLSVVNLEKMLRFFLLVNKQGQTRFSRYYNTQLQPEERVLMEADISRKCLKRGDSQVRIINF